MKSQLISALKVGTASCVLGAALIAAPAFAADKAATPSDSNDVIIVTGSRIARSDLQSSSPVSVISAQDLKLTNSVTAEVYLTQNPQFVSSITATTNNGGNGAASVDLRGLGSNRTLVLVDGRRMVPGDIGGAVDINAIPTVLIKKIDVLTGGASAVYGADAISGVVNFVLDDKFKGFKAEGSSQLTTYGDAPERNVAAIGGLTFGERGHFVVAGQYTTRSGVFQSARAYSQQNLDANLNPSGSSNALPTVIDINAGRFQINDGTQAGGSGNFVPFYKPYNFNPANYLSTPFERYSVTAIASYDLSSKAELYARGTYTNSKVTLTLAPTATAGFNFIISPNNPFLNAANNALIFGDPNNLNADGTANVGIRRRIVESGGRIEKFNTDNYFGIVGVKGDLTSSLHYDIFAQYGLNKRHEDLLNDLDYNKISQAINAVSTPGGPACANPAGGCVPINLFSTSPISPSALNYVLTNGAQDNRFTQFVTGGSLSGDLGFIKSPLASKPAAFSIGAEYRSETGSQAVDANYGSGNLIYYGQGTAVPNASFNVKEIFGELKLPLISDRPFIQSLNFEGGARYSDYTNNTFNPNPAQSHFKEWTYKYGGDWTPVAGFRIRALYNHAVRDPDIFSLNAPITQAGTDVLQTDPCANGKPHGNSALAAICIAQGAPASVVNTGVIQDVISNQTNINAGGNPGLKPEAANTFTAGFVASPKALHGFNLTVDYYNIKITNFIGTDSAQDISNQCFNNNIQAFCGLIVRNVINGQLTGSQNGSGPFAGQFPGVSEVAVNIASLQTQGIDVTADYRFKFAHNHSLLLSLAGTYVGQWTFQATPATAPFTCAGKFGNTCNIGTGNPIPRWKHIATATYDGGNWSIRGAWRYFGPVSEDAGTNIAASHIASYSWFDTTVSFDIAKRFNLNLGATNIFNVQPPVVGGSAGSSGTNSGNTFPNVYDALGRTFFAGVSVKF